MESPEQHVSIRMSPLGRAVWVGDIYNYYSDSIVHLDRDQVPGPSIHIEQKPAAETVRYFWCQKPDKLKPIMLGISSRQEQNIRQGTLSLDQLWFADYLKPNPTLENMAQVTALFKITRRIETLDPQFIQSTLRNYQLNSVGKWTHLVKQVVYGAEFICSMWRPVNLGRETKELVEERILQAAKFYFERDYFTCPEPPMELIDVRCTIFSSIEAYHATECSVQQFVNALTHLQKPNPVEEKLRPIDIALLYIPEQMEIRFLTDKIDDKKMEIEEKWHEITKKSDKLFNCPFIDHVPPLVKMMSDFRELSTLLWNEIDRFKQSAVIAKTSEQQNILGEFQVIINLLNGIQDWLTVQYTEVEAICILLRSAQLPVLDLEEIKNKFPSSDGETFAKVFILKADYIQDPVMENIQKTLQLQQSFLIPKFNIASAGEQRYVEISRILIYFTNEANRMLPTNDTSYYVGLVESSTPFNDGDITTIKYPQVSSSSAFTSDMFSGLKSTLVSITSSQTVAANYPQNGGVDADDTAMSSDDSDKESGNPGRFQPSMVTQFYVPTTESITAKVKLNWISESPIRSVETEETAREIAADVNDSNKKKIENKRSIDATNDGKPSVKSLKRENRSQSVITIGNSNQMEPTTTQYNFTNQLTRRGNSLTQRIAEIFANESNDYSRLVKTSQPNIHLLNAKQRPAGIDFQWFDIGLPNGDQSSYQNHKTIILMGATGSGKSTLIDGMVNYILGVKWTDQFRFKCVREDESLARNQALSQTSSVTAYTIHHHEGMTVPYSVTIIDTPGYGDTRGVARDKEITQMIHRFLTQDETRIEEIHAACFVAASGNSRLTATQRYILDSVLSIFGKDVKENIRLLVTFADNADPPVVEACRVGNFPVTSPSAGITYSKFNSSVLYTCNEGGSFDELFWEMGQENFGKFFNMLERMKGKDLRSTRQVIENRQLLQQSMKSIERELEICLIQIENKEMFRAKLSAHGRNNNNCSFEKAEMRLVEVKCDKGFWGYNCLKCQQTCDSGVTNFANYEKTDSCRKQMCPCPDNDHAFQETEWRTTSVMTRTTLLEMKAEYESLHGKTMTNEQLLAECFDELNDTKGKILNLLKQVGDRTRLLESTALRSNALSPAEYLSLMRSRVTEEQKPGYLTRLETLGELQQMIVSHNNVPMIVVSPSVDSMTSSIKANTGCRSRGRTSFPYGDNILTRRRKNVVYFKD